MRSILESLIRSSSARRASSCRRRSFWAWIRTRALKWFSAWLRVTAKTTLDIEMACVDDRGSDAARPTFRQPDADAIRSAEHGSLPTDPRQDP